MTRDERWPSVRYLRCLYFDATRTCVETLHFSLVCRVCSFSVTSRTPDDFFLVESASADAVLTVRILLQDVLRSLRS